MLARWEHVDIGKAEWHIPAENSKTGKPHIVYLSPQALALFAELRSLAGGSELVLPGRGSLTKPFAHNAMNNALKVALRGQHIPTFTIHDLRRTASTLLHEHGWPADVVEKALNHTIGGVRGVYNRAEYAGQRREMLGFWGEYVEGLGEGGVIGGGVFVPADRNRLIAVVPARPVHRPVSPLTACCSTPESSRSTLEFTRMRQP